MVLAMTFSLVLPAYGHASGCVMPAPTKINVIPSTKPVVYDYNQSLQNIQEIETDTKNPYGLHAMTITQGFMKGQIQFTPKVKLDFAVVPQSRSVCLWYEEIDLRIEIDPTIVIGREVASDPCMKAAVIDHEHKHVTADREVVNKYAQRMGTRIYQRLKEHGFVVGPIDAKEAQEAADRMHNVVHAVLKVEYAKMEQERAMAQQRIDSREEYNRVAKLCPKFNPSRYINRAE